MFCDVITEGLNYELKEYGVDVLGIRSFGLMSVNKKTSIQTGVYRRFFNVTADQCFRESMSKCTSGLIFGSWQHEVLGIFIQNVMDLMPFESRMLITSSMGAKLIEDVKGIKI